MNKKIYDKIVTASGFTRKIKIDFKSIKFTNTSYLRNQESDYINSPAVSASLFKTCTNDKSFAQAKACSRCKNIKPINQFYKDNKSSDGYNSNCNSCKNEIKNRKIECSCNRFTTINHYSRHIKSNIHSILIRSK